MNSTTKIGMPWLTSFVHPSSGERYYVRMLLIIVRGAKSFDDLKIIDGTKYATFGEACMTLGLVADNNE